MAGSGFFLPATGNDEKSPEWNHFMGYFLIKRENSMRMFSFFNILVLYSVLVKRFSLNKILTG